MGLGRSKGLRQKNGSFAVETEVAQRNCSVVFVLLQGDSFHAELKTSVGCFLLDFDSFEQFLEFSCIEQIACLLRLCRVVDDDFD